jgi:thiamine-phosphate pyrophosphorylase
MLLCAITDRKQLPAGTGPEAPLRRQLLILAQEWATAGINFIQIREKDLSKPDLHSLTGEMVEKIGHSRSKLLVNISTLEAAPLAAHAGADGLHLAGKLMPGATRSVRQFFRAAGRDPIISVPCHTLDDIYVARKEQVDLILFSPIFEKRVGPLAAPQGLEALRRACGAAAGIPVFALGGVTSLNAADCITAGAAGVAGIRLFAVGNWRQLLPAN